MRQRGCDDRLVEGGQKHAEHQTDDDDDRLAMREVWGVGLSSGRQEAGPSGYRIRPRIRAAVSAAGVMANSDPWERIGAWRFGCAENSGSPALTRHLPGWSDCGPLPWRHKAAGLPGRGC